jgi:polar amino acid transport system substrate-binding protein
LPAKKSAISEQECKTSVLRQSESFALLIYQCAGEKTMKILLLMIAIIGAFLAFCAITDAEEITLASMEWEDYVNADGTGFYAEIIKAIYEPAGVKVTFQIVPWARAVRMVLNKDADALVADSDTSPVPELLHSEYPLDVAHAYYLTKKSQLYTDQNSFRGKTIGWIRGFNFDKKIALPKGAYTIHEVAEVVTGIRMIQKGRLDFFIDYKEGIEAEAEKYQIDLSDCQIITGFEERYLMGFANTEKGKRLLQTYEDRFKTLYQAGELRTLLQTSGVEAGLIEQETVDQILQIVQQKINAEK